MEYMSGNVSGLFLTMLNPMGYIIGLALSSIVVKYAIGFIQYYFKLAHIVYLTMLILEYKPYRGSRLVHALTQAAINFPSLALNDFTTRGVIKALGALKDAILNIDLLSKFKEPKNSAVKFVKSICTTGLSNVINMTDEIIVSYTWFTNDLYLANREKTGKGKPNLKDKVKNQAAFMLEGMLFTVRVMPQLMLNSLIFEVAFIILANAITITSIVVFIGYKGFSFFYLFCAIILYRTLISLFYYAIIESLRLNLYLYSFYSELEELEPFNIKETLADLMGKVPLLSPLVKKSGQKIKPTGVEGTPILEGDLNTILKENVTQVASAFNLNTKDLVDSEDQKVEQTEEQPEPLKEESNTNNEDDLEHLEEVNESEPQENVVEIVEEVEPTISVDEIEIEVETSSSPFTTANRVNNQRR